MLLYKLVKRKGCEGGGLAVWLGVDWSSDWFMAVRAICASGVLVATLGSRMNALDIPAARLGYSAI